MAMATTPHPQPMAQQGHTQGVGQTGQQPMQSPGVVGQMQPAHGGVAQTPATMPAKPVLFDDLEPVHYARLYPDAKSSDEAKAEAKKAGQAAYDASAKIVAAAQVETTEVPPEGGAPAAPSTKDTIKETASLVSNAANQALKERGDPRAPAEAAAPHA